ncbi:MAG: polynucleotide adenylyltransferase PcnB [Pseudomonadota bacterium]
MIPNIIPRPSHIISRAHISENALTVLRRLRRAGFQAYLVGGGVRDLLLGREPKDFDVATDASPEQVRQVFYNCRLIGRRFRLAHVHFGQDIVEVATFRGSGTETEEETGDRCLKNGRIIRDNIYGTLEEDALRRDFTVNALYYNIEDFSVVDFAGGMADLQAGRLRLIGDPDQRYREDPVRMLRAVRFAAKLGFQLSPECEAPLSRMSHLLHEVPAARLFEEILKLMLYGTAVEAFEKLRHYGLFAHLFPVTEEALTHEEGQFPLLLVARGLANTDQRTLQGKPVTPAFLFAILLWEPVRRRMLALEDQGHPPQAAVHEAADQVLISQQRLVGIPKRFSLPMREIWALQERFESRTGKRPFRFVEHPRFRAAFDFMMLRAEVGEVEADVAAWWRDFQKADEAGRLALLTPHKQRAHRRRRRRGGARGRAATQTID